MRITPIILSGTVVLAAFGGGFFFGREITKEPEKVTMSMPEENIKTVLAAEPPKPTPTYAEVFPTEKPEEKKYLLMLSGESICIYSLLQDGSTVLMQKKEMDTGQLRQEDYESLCRGITVDNLDEALSLCEDFGN